MSRILFYDPILTGHHGKYATKIIETAIENDHQVKFVTWEDVDRLKMIEETGAGTAVLGQESFGRSSIERLYQPYLGYKKAHSIASSWNADIIHHLWLDQTEIQLLISRLSPLSPGTKMFATLFNPRYKRKSDSTLKTTWRRANLMTAIAMTRSGILDSIFIHSESIRKNMLGYGFDENDLALIPDPVEVPEEVPTKSDARNELGLGDKDTILLFFGGLREDKGADVLLDTIPECDWSGVTFLVAGTADAATTSRVLEIQSSTNNAQVVYHRGFVPEENVKLYFAACDAVLLPYRDVYSGTSGILQRAASFERPVIATTTGVVGTTVQEYDLGVTITPDSGHALMKGVQKFIEKEQYYSERVKRNALEYAKEHSYEKMTGLMLKEYDINQYRDIHE